MAEDDRTIRQHITELVEEEHDLRRRLGAGEITGEEERARLQSLERELDQCWDLLRQRDARRGAGQDPDAAVVRDEETVEKYLS